ncbi:capsular polysaccharide biosynthesis protein [Halalkalibacter kiskunsagensis]|uniref:Capsular polysaccharide biosynthesis protein n=1 Tax=Halalkalibacter kiskunsagensis TaxID=1548599 RepID=A0ABV6KG82_9BACI
MVIKKGYRRARKLFGLLRNVLHWQVTNYENKDIAFVFNVSKWKQVYLRSYLAEYEVIYVTTKLEVRIFERLNKSHSSKTIFVWGYSAKPNLVHFAKQKAMPFYRIEDGFVRSKGLGALHNAPYSLCIDKQGMYFDSNQKSDLEDILNHYDFDSNKDLLNRSRNCINQLIELEVSKYNHVQKKNLDVIYGEKTRKRILVIGQVEEDASIRYGCATPTTNNDLVKLASKENPEAEIIYKPHPDVLAGKRKMISDPEEVKQIAKIVYEPLSLVDSLKTIDHVYTITSLSGFEALLRGIKVTTVGAPFYSGWGLTDDRQNVSRRKRKLTTEQLFAGAYILYPIYIDPNTGKRISLEDTISKVSQSSK